MSSRRAKDAGLITSTFPAALGTSAAGRQGVRLASRIACPSRPPFVVYAPAPEGDPLPAQEPQTHDDGDQGRQPPAFGDDLGALDLEDVTTIHEEDLQGMGAQDRQAGPGETGAFNGPTVSSRRAGVRLAALCGRILTTSLVEWLRLESPCRAPGLAQAAPDVMVGQKRQDPVMPKEPQISQEAWRAALTLTLVETGVRHSRLEELHTGTAPASAVGDYSDVKVVTPYGEIPWSQVSRLCDEEMKGLMIEVVDRVYTLLSHPEPFLRLMGARAWNKPALDPAMMDAVARHEARARGLAEDEIWTTWPLDEAKRRPPLRVEHRAAAEREAADAADQAETPRPPWSFDATPDSLRALANAPIADATWIAKAREALAVAADQWESANLQALDEIEAGAYGQD